MKKTITLVVVACLFLTFLTTKLAAQGNTCPQATPFCTAVGTPFTYPNVHNGSIAPATGVNYGCLCQADAVNPSWFYIKTTAAGTMNFNIGQTNTGGSGIDVDFVAWGPFTSMTNVCTMLTGGCNSGCGSYANSTCTGNIEDCESSPAATENMSLVSPAAGQYFLIMVTNFDGSAGNITITQTGGPGTDCSITCPSVLSGPGIVNAPSTNPQAGVAATPLPAVVSCTAGLIDMYASNVTPFGNPITPGVMINSYVNNRANNTIRWYENGLQVGNASTLTANTSSQLQVGYMSVTAVESFSFCEAQSGTNMPSSITDMATGATINTFTWTADGVCSGYTIPAGAIKGITTWGSSCGACLTNVTDWGYASFNPAIAGPGTHTITYSFNPQSGSCPTYTTSAIIQVTNPFNAAFTPPGPLCASGACANLTPQNTYGTGTSGWSGTGVTGAQFCPASSGAGTFPVTYSVGTTAACKASYTANVVVSNGPAASAGSPAMLTCASTSTTLAGSGGGTYNWSGPGVVSGNTTATPTVNQPGVYTVTVTASGCSAVSTVSVSQNTTPPGATASGSGSVTCSTNTITLTGGPAAGVTYAWTGPGFSGGTTGQNATGTGAGTYTLTTTSTANGCTSTALATVGTNNTPPGATASNSGSVTCSTNTISLTGGPASGVTYAWAGPGFSGTTTGQNATGVGAGNYTLTTTSTVNGCTSTAVTNVGTNGSLPAATATPGGSVTCVTNTVALTGGPASGVTYTWTGPGFSGGTNGQNATASGAGTYTLITTSTINGCTNTAVATVGSNLTQPTVGPSSTGMLTCVSTTLSLTTSPAAMNYTWTAPGGSSITGGTNSQNATATGAGPFTVTVVDPANGCARSATVAPSTNYTIITPTIALPAVLNCTATTISLSSTPAAGVTYTWTGGGLASGANTTAPGVNQPGVYTLSVTNTANGCVGSATTNVTQNTTAPTVTISPTTQTITCANPTVSLSGSATPAGSSPTWAGGACAGAGTYTASICSPGTYTLTVTNPANGCTGFATAVVSPSSGLPSVTASNTGSITCATTSVQVTASTTMTPVSYSWSGPGSIGNSSAATTSVSAGGIYQCVVTNTLTGCASTITTNVPVDITPVAASISPTGSITCATTSLVLNASPTGGAYTYSWTGSGLSGNTVSTPTVAQGGSFDVLITNTVNGCTGTASISVGTNTTNPTLNVSATAYTTTCASPTVQITSTPSDPAVTYSWTAPSTGSLNNSTIQNPIATGIGEFTVVITSTVSGCSSQQSAATTVTVVPDADIPVVTLSASSLSLTCSSSTVSAIATTTASPVSYTWNPGPQSGGNSNTAVFNTPGQYTLTVTNTNNGCSTTANVSVGTNTTQPALAISPSQTLSCANPMVTISTTVTPASGAGYSWTGPGISGGTTNATADANLPGTYTVVVTDAANGCTNTATSDVFGNTVAPTATISTSGGNNLITCANPTVNLLVNSTPATGVSYVWSPTGAMTNTTNATSAGNYSATVLNTANGCSVTVTFSLTANTTPPPVSTTNTSIPCAANSTTISAICTNTNTTYSWSTNGGTILSGGNSPDPEVGSAGNYVVTVTDVATGCVNTATVTVSQSSVTAGFSANPTSGISPLNVDFTNLSQGATGYSWTFGDGNTSGSSDPSNTYMGQGTYTVMLVATAGSCADTAWAVIVVEDGLSLEIPNVFTPNGDGVNDVFTIKSTGIKEISLQIFNRWGQRLYEFAGAKAAWDGVEANGKGVTDGTYFFFVKAEGYDGRKIEKEGTVNLYR